MRAPPPDRTAGNGTDGDPGIDLLFLGTGTSLGVPVVGCECAVCRSPDPRDRRTRASVYLRTPECAWVVDTGPDFRAQCLRENIRAIDAVVYTHAHTDHVMGFDDLRPFCDLRRPLPIFASAATMDDLRRIYAFAFDGHHRYPGYVCPDPRVIDGPFALGATTVTPVPVLHGRTTVNGYLFARDGRPLVAYLSDCKTVPPAAIHALAGVDTLVIDALRAAPHPTHMNLAEALAVVGEIRPARTWFTHLSHDAGHAATAAALPADVAVAWDGLRLTVT